LEKLASQKERLISYSKIIIFRIRSPQFFTSKSYESGNVLGIELKRLINYNSYRLGMKIEDENLRELYAIARAIHFAMRQGAISPQQAKQRTNPILNRINTSIKLIAKKYNKTPRYITFQDLGRA
jgi:hypothetical protein